MITKLGPWANSFSCSSVSGFLDMLVTHLDFGAVEVIVVDLEKSVPVLAVDAVAVWLKLSVPL